MFNYRRPRVAIVVQLARRMFYKGLVRSMETSRKQLTRRKKEDQVCPSNSSKRACYLFVVFDMLRQTRAFNKETKDQRWKVKDACGSLNSELYHRGQVGISQETSTLCLIIAH